jgi:hypothetical protein
MVKNEVIVVSKWGIMVEAKKLQVLVNDITIGRIQRCLHSFPTNMQACRISSSKTTCTSSSTYDPFYVVLGQDY